MDSSELALAYQEVRNRCLALAKEITSEQAAIATPCCPEWSVKDTFAHLAGVPADVLTGNIENAATAEWADAQISARAHLSLQEICEELDHKGSEMDDVIRSMGAKTMPRFYLDCWTHEWDIRHALGAWTTPDLTLPVYAWPFLAEKLGELSRSANAEAITLAVQLPDRTDTVALGTGEPTRTVELSLFEAMRVTMGRRSRAQIEAMGLDPGAVVIWTPNSVDIVEHPQP